MQKFKNNERGFIETVMIVSTIVTIITLSVASKVYEMNKQAEEKYPAPQGSIFNDIKESIVKSVSKSPIDLGKTPSNTAIRSNTTYGITTNNNLSNSQQNSSNSQISSGSEIDSTSSGSSNSSNRRSGGGGGSSNDSGGGDNSNTGGSTNDVSGNTGTSETTTSGTTENSTNQQSNTNTTTQTTTNYSAARPSLPSFVVFDSLRFDESGKAAPEGYDRLQISFTTTNQGVPPLGTDVISLDSNDIFSPISSLIQIPVFLGKSSGNINKKIDDFESGIFVRRNYPEVEILFKGGSPSDRSKTRLVLKTNSGKNISCKGIYLDKGEDVLNQINSEICEVKLEMGGGINGLYDGILLTYSDKSNAITPPPPEIPEAECKTDIDCDDGKEDTKDTCELNFCNYEKITPTEPAPSEPIIDETGQKTFYIDPNSKDGPCSDSNPGTINKPWCSVKKISSLEAGQTALIRESTIRGAFIQMDNPGNEDEPITIKNYRNEKVVIGDPKYGATFSLSCKIDPDTNIETDVCADWVSIEGLNFENDRISVQNSNYFTFKDNVLNNAVVKIWGPKGSKNASIINNTFNQCGNPKTNSGACITGFVGSHDLLIQGNDIQGAGHAGIDLAIDSVKKENKNTGEWTWTYPDHTHKNVVVYDNQIHDNYYIGLAMSGGLSDYTIEENEFYKNCKYEGADIAWKSVSKLNGQNGEFINNNIHDNYCNGLKLQAWADNYIPGDDEPKNNTISGNTFANNFNKLETSKTVVYDIVIQHLNHNVQGVYLGLKKTQDNTFLNNTLSGIRWDVTADTDYTESATDFYGNMFKENTFLDDEKVKLQIDYKTGQVVYKSVTEIEEKFTNFIGNSGPTSVSQNDPLLLKGLFKSTFDFLNLGKVSVPNYALTIFSFFNRF